MAEELLLTSAKNKWTSLHLSTHPVLKKAEWIKKENSKECIHKSETYWALASHDCSVCSRSNKGAMLYTKYSVNS